MLRAGAKSILYATLCLAVLAWAGCSGGLDKNDAGDGGDADGGVDAGDGSDAGDIECPEPEIHEEYCINPLGWECDIISSYCRDGEWQCRPGREHPPAMPEFEDWAWRCGVYRCYAQNIPSEPGDDWQEEGSYVPPDPASLTGEWVLVADGDDVVAQGCERQPLQFAEGDSLAVDPLNPDVMYAGFGLEETRGSFWVSGVFKSVDGGASWFEARAGLGSAGCGPYPWNECTYGPSVNRLFIDPEDPQVLFASTDERGLYRTLDGGRHWEHVLDVCGWGFAGPVIRTPGGTYFAGCYDALLRSLDGGLSWPWYTQEPLSRLGRWVTALGVDRSRPERLWVGVGGGLNGSPGEGYLYLSDDQGESWMERGQELDQACEGQGLVAAIAVCEADPSQMAVAALYCGLFLSNDGGQSWRRAPEPMHLGIVVDARFAPWPDRCELFVDMLASEIGGTWSTADGGLTWRLEVDRMLSDIFFNPYLPQIITGINAWQGNWEDPFELWMRR